MAGSTTNMSTLATTTSARPGRFWKAGLQVAVLVLLVPAGISVGYQMLAPSSRTLVQRAAGGADSAALLELVERVQRQPHTDAELQGLLRGDAAALQSLAGLAAGNEAAMQYLIQLARREPGTVAPLADMEVSSDYALAMLRHIGPAGVAGLQQNAQHSACACFMLAVAYELGCNVPQNWSLAAHWYARARELGYLVAEARFAGAAYEAALQSSGAEAARWFREAAQCGHAAAQCALGVCYASGEGLEVDLREAVAWYRKAAGQGMADAQYNLAWCLLHGEGVEPDAAAAVHWFRLAAEQGDDLSQYYLGRAYELGEGAPQDFSEAVRWYRWAVEQGNAAAQCALGYCYAQGRGVPQSWPQAVHYYQLSAQQGRAEAQLALAECLERGLGIARNLAAAQYWRQLADSGFQSTTLPEST